MIADRRKCQLGEGLLWHPLTEQLYWFDILGCKLLRDDGTEWAFSEHVSAAGWLDETRLIIASETALFEFDTRDGTRRDIVPLEENLPETRSNDGRADPYGGFWIGTMGKNAEPSLGAIYRYYLGELRELYPALTITNSICFAPDHSTAYFTDTKQGQLMQVSLDDHGWPVGEPEVLLDLSAQEFGIDGSVTAADGTILNAQWGANRVAHYGADGTMIESFEFPASQISCPALGGPDLNILFATSAQQGMSAAQLDAEPSAGMLFSVETKLKGWPEPKVIL